MKVVLFCGGLGMRLRDYSHTIPKPMVPLRYRPILWHVMKYYAHYGHRDFILCLGHKGDAIKDYFLNYSECLSNDFVLSDGGQRIDLLRSDISDWRITFVDTGLTSNIGERLKLVEPFLKSEEVFLANYSDGLTDCPLPRLIDWFHARRSVATFIAVRPNHSFHVTTLEDDGSVTGIHDVQTSGMWINGGYFVLHREIFDFMRAGDELVLAPFQRLIERRALSAYPYEGFWRGVDTFKDLQELENSLSQGDGAWEVWRKQPLADLAPAGATVHIPPRLLGRRNGGQSPSLRDD